MNWSIVCMEKKDRGLGIRNLSRLNKALLGNGIGDLLQSKILYGNK